MRHEARFPAVRTSALDARRFVSEVIADVPDDVSDTVTLIASELATNSVRHAASGFEIRIERHPDRIHIEVEDDGGGEPVVRSPGPRDTSGRGLQIVTALADDWGVIPRDEVPGKTVWATVALRTDDGAPQTQSGETERRHRRGGASGGSGSSAMLHPLSTDAGHGRLGPRLCARRGRAIRSTTSVR